MRGCDESGSVNACNEERESETSMYLVFVVSWVSSWRHKYIAASSAVYMDAALDSL